MKNYQSKVQGGSMSNKNIMNDNQVGEIIDAFHIMSDGKKVRVFPGTGSEVDPAALGSDVRWVGDSIGFGEAEFVDLVDQLGNWASIPADLVRTHEVWVRINAYGQKRITDGLNLLD